MASSPPFQVEDHTDEDFFDKLVNDDDDDFTAPSSSSVPNLDDDNDSDEAKAFANLSIGEDSGGENGSEAIGEYHKTEPANTHKEDKASSLVSSNSVVFDNVIESKKGVIGTELALDLTAPKCSQNSKKVSGLNNGNIGSEMVSGLSASKISGSGGSGVKEVQWSAFNLDSLQNGGNGFGSYSDLFGEFGDGGNAVENLNSEPNLVSNGKEYKSASLDNAHNHSQYQEGEVYGTEREQSADVQDLNYWETLYPGWKYDQNTGQWYQVDGYNATTSAQGSFDMAVCDGKSEISYLRQTTQSAVGTLPQTGTTESVTNWNQDSQAGDASQRGLNWNQVSQAADSTESVSNWNQVSQGNNEYPSHMIFDAQYPGWYYDTIAQEWRSLDTYMSSAQSSFQAENHLNQNGFGTSLENDLKTQGVNGKVDKYGSGGFSNEGQDYNWAGSFSQQGSNMWQSDSVASSVATSEFSGSKQLDNNYGQEFSVSNNVSQQKSYEYGETIFYNEKASPGHNQGFVPPGNFSHQFNQSRIKQNEHMQTSNDYYGTQSVVSYSQQPYQSGHQFSYAPAAGRSSAGRPPHALVAFGFGGKLIMMKDNTSLGNASYGRQDPVGSSISVLNLMEVVNGRIDASSTRSGVCDYFHTLCRQSFPGPLTGGNVAVKELNRWTDERIAHCESSDMDYRKGEVLRLLLSLLKIACQHYGKLRSPFGTDTMLKENDSPESAVARLFASAKRNGSQINEYGALAHCLQKLPSEGQMRATAAEVQTLLVCGRKKEALHCAQEGQLWGPALVLAAQLGDQFYIDTVKQMALRQLVAGSPLRTLCLLIAGQPAEVFSTNTAADGSISSAINMSQPPAQLGANGMLDDWEENLAVITANRTKDDELVLIHLGDCLWKERSEIIAAHICYLVAEANFEPYSDSARLCLVGADHFKFPRTYASPESIQRTEIYEYSKLLGNSQFILLPFQPYKLVYAYMLAEVGKVSDSLKYCQAVSKSLKIGRAPEVEKWRQLASSLEERIKIHQQGGFSTNLAPAKLVGKLLNLFDSTAHRVVGGLPPPAPSTNVGSIQGNEHYNQSSGLRVSASQSTMAMSSLIPSASMEPISEWTADGNRMKMHNRSVSEPDFSRTPRQDQVDSSKEATSANAHGKASVSGGASRFGRFGFGSQFLQKILKPRQDKQAKLGETNKFYYDEKLKRWVEEGVDPPAEEAALPPPPTTGAFPNRTDYNLNSALKNEGSLSSGSPPSPAHSAGIPPIPPTSNQFSARGRMGVRSRYVDTFNQGGGNPTNLFQSPNVPSIKPKSNSNPKFFVPTPVSSVEQPVNATADNIQHYTLGNENPTASSMNDSFQSFAPPSSMNMQRFASMDNISNKGATTTGIGNGRGNGSLSSLSRRTASWSGSFAESFSPPSKAEMKPLGEVLGMPPSSFMPNNPALMHSSVNGGSYGDDLHEVEL